MDSTFSLTFDELDELERQPEDLQNQVLGSLTPDELDVYDRVAKQREEFKAQPQQEALAPTTTLEQVGRSVAQVGTDFSSAYQKNLEQAAAEDSMLGAALAPLDAAAQATIGRAVSAFQESVGAPIVNKVAKQFGPAGAFTVRQLGSLLGGQANVEQVDEKELMAAVNAYEDMFGPTGAGVAQFAVQQAGQAPLFFMRAPKALGALMESAVSAAPALKLTPEFAAAYPRLTALLGTAGQVGRTAVVGAGEGAVMNVAAGVLSEPEAKVSELALQGAAFGGGVGAAVPVLAKLPGATQPVKQGVKTLAVATKNGLNDLGAELNSVMDIAALSEKAQKTGLKQVESPLPKGKVQKVEPEAITKPTQVVFGRDVNMNPVARVVELKSGLVGAGVKYAELPIDTPAQQARVGKLMQDRRIGYSNEDIIPGFMDDWEMTARLTTGWEKETVVTPTGLQEAPRRVDTPDMRPVALLQDGDTIVTTPMGEQYRSPNDPLALGDDVVVSARGGAEHDGVVVGGTPEGKVKVETDVGVLEVEPMQVRHSQPPPPPAEALAESPLARDMTRAATREVEGAPGRALPPAATEADIAYLSAVEENPRRNLRLSRQPAPEEFPLPSQRGAYEEYWREAPGNMPDPTEMRRVNVKHPDQNVQAQQLAQFIRYDSRTVSMNRLRELTNLTRRELVETLHFAEQQGWVTRTKRGWRTTPEQKVALDGMPVSDNFKLDVLAKQPKDEPPAFTLRPGEGAFIERKPGAEKGRGEAVHYLGMDPTKPGNAYVRRADGTYLSIPAEKVYTAEPPGTSRGPLYPPLPPAPPPGQLANTKTLVQLDATKRIADAVKDKPGFFERILPAHNYVAQEAAELMLRLDGARHTGALETKLSIAEQLAKQTKQPLYGSFDKDLNAFLNGKLSDADMLTKHGTVWTEVMKVMDPLLKRAEFIDRELTKMGYVDASLAAARARGEAPRYVAKIYEMFVKKPGEHAASLQAKVIDDLADYITTELLREGKTPLRSTVSAELMEVLRAASPVEAWAKRAGTGSTPKSFKHLMRRKNLPSQIEAALTPVESGLMRTMYSLAQQETIYHSLTAMDAIYNSKVSARDSFGNMVDENPYWSPGPRRDLPVEVPNDPKKYGKLAGGYTSRQMWEYLSDFSNASDQLGSFARSFITYQKMGQVVFNPKTWMNATIGNLEGSILAGGLDLTRPGAVLDMAEALRQMRTYAKTGDINQAPLVYEAKKYGVDPEGLMSKEYGFVMNRMADIIEKSQRGGGNLLNLVSDLKDGLRNLPHDAAKYYNLIDRTFKLANYAALRKKFMAEAAGKGLSGQAAIDYAASKSSYRIAQSFPMPYRPNKIAQTFQRSALAGWLGNPYVTTATELARVHLQLPRRLIKEPDLAARVMLWSGFVAGLAATSQYIATANGMTPDVVDAMIENQPDYARSNRVLTFVWPWWYDDPMRKDANGKPLKSFYMHDLTGALDMARLGQGDPNDPVLARAASNVPSIFLNQYFAGGIKDLMSRSGFITPPKKYDTTPRPDQRGLQATLDAIFAAGYGSTGVTAAAKAAQRTDPNVMQYKPLQQALTPAQAAIQTIVPGKFVGSLDRAKGVFEVKGEVKAIQEALRQMATDPEYINAPPAEQARRRQVYIDMLNELSKKQQTRAAKNAKAGL